LWVKAFPYGASQTHPLDTPHLVGLLWTSDQPNAQTSTWQHTTLTRDSINAPGRNRNHNPSQREAANSILRPRGHWDWHLVSLQVEN